MNDCARMKRAKLLDNVTREAHLSVGVVGLERQSDAVFHGTVGLRLVLDLEQGIELMRCLVEEMQSTEIDHLLEIELEPGTLELFTDKQPAPAYDGPKD